MKEFKCKITAQPIKDGFLNIPANLVKNFPEGKEALKITAIFENENLPIQLTYNPKHKMLFGLTAWYREHGAQPGDFIKFKVVQPSNKYKLIFEKGKREGTLKKFNKENKLDNYIKMAVSNNPRDFGKSLANLLK